jgi:ribosomal protein S18 acetylase RimI-like enzyme
MDHLTSVTVRRATPADAEAVQLLLLELADHEGSGQHVHVDVSSWRELLAEPDVVVLLAEQADGPVGYVSAVRQLSLWQGRHLLAVDDLYVRAGHRDRGVGEALMHGIADTAAADGRPMVRWELDRDNDGARRFYLRLGATVCDKGIAVWAPHDYMAVLTPRGGR